MVSIWSHSCRHDNVNWSHQFQQAEYQRGALSDDVVGLTAELHKAV